MVQWIQNEILLKLLDDKSRKNDSSISTADEVEAVSQLPIVKNIPEVIMAAGTPEIVKVEAGVQANRSLEPASKKDEMNQTSEVAESAPNIIRHDILPFAREISECILDEVIGRESRKIGKSVHSEIFEEELLNKLNQESVSRSQFLAAIEAQRKEDQSEREKMIQEFNAEREKLLAAIREARKEAKENSILVSHETEEAFMMLRQKLESTSPITSSPIKVVVKDQAVQSVVPNLSFEEPTNNHMEHIVKVQEEILENDIHDPYKVSGRLETQVENLVLNENTVTTDQNPVATEYKVNTAIVPEAKTESSKNIAFIHIGIEPALVEKSLEKVSCLYSLHQGN